MWLWCLCVWRNCFIGLDLTFHNYQMGRLIAAKYYKNFKWKITIEVQRTTKNFTRFMFICFWHFCSFSSLIEEVPFAYFILLWWIIRRDVEASSEFPFLLVCVNQSLMLFPVVFVVSFPLRQLHSCEELSPRLNTCLIGSISELYLPNSSHTDDIRPVFFFPQP